MKKVLLILGVILFIPVIVLAIAGGQGKAKGNSCMPQCMKENADSFDSSKELTQFCKEECNIGTGQGKCLTTEDGCCVPYTDDPDCCETNEIGLCNDGVDNDCDDHVDLEDTDCQIGDCFDPNDVAEHGYDVFFNTCSELTNGCYACNPYYLWACYKCALWGYSCDYCAIQLQYRCSGICCIPQGDEICGDGKDQDCDGINPEATPENLEAGLCPGGLYITSDFTFPSGTYRFTNIHGGWNQRITVGADNVNLDCNGATIDADGRTAIVVRKQDGVTIQNCNIMNAVTAIDVRDGTNSQILNNQVSSSSAGICMCSIGYGGSSGLVSGNDVTNSGDGIAVIQSSPTLTTNRACGNSRDYLCNIASIVDGGDNIGNNNYGCSLSLTPC